MKALVMIAAVMLAPCAARGQDHWTGVGAIGHTAMYIDTTTIVRDGPLRKVWIKSVDLTPTTVVIGTDTVTFDTVAALNVLDCSSRTYSVQSVHYYYGDAATFSASGPTDTPKPIVPKSFLGAVYTDMCHRR